MLQKLGRFPFVQIFRDFRPKLNGTVKILGSFRKFRNTFSVHPLWWNFWNYRKFCVPFARDVGFSLSTKRELTWILEKALIEMVSKSPDKYAGMVTSKYPFKRVNSLRMKQATVARSITSSLLSRMVQLIVSQSSCSKAAKSPPFSNTTKFYPACPVWPQILGGGRIRPANPPKILLNGKCPWISSSLMSHVTSM